MGFLPQTLAVECPFLFSFATRRTFFELSSFGATRAMLMLQERSRIHIGVAVDIAECTPAEFCLGAENPEQGKGSRTLHGSKLLLRPRVK